MSIQSMESLQTRVPSRYDKIKRKYDRQETITPDKKNIKGVGEVITDEKGNMTVNLSGKTRNNLNFYVDKKGNTWVEWGYGRVHKRVRLGKVKGEISINGTEKDDKINVMLAGNAKLNIKGDKGNDNIRVHAYGGNNQIDIESGEGNDKLRIFSKGNNNRIFKEEDPNTEGGNDKVKLRALGNKNSIYLSNYGNGNDNFNVAATGNENILFSAGLAGDDKIKIKAKGDNNMLVAAGNSGNDDLTLLANGKDNSIMGLGGKGNDRIDISGSGNLQEIRLGLGGEDDYFNIGFDGSWGEFWADELPSLYIKKGRGLITTFDSIEPGLLGFDVTA